MPTVLRFRRGDTTASNAFTGAEGELFVDTTKDTVVVHDGVTAGGKPLATEAALTSGLAGKADASALSSYATTSALTSGLAGKADASALSSYATTSALTSGLAGKQDTLVSGTNIKTVNGTSLLGSGNIVISGGGGGGDLTQVASDIIPLIDDVYDLGSSTNRFYDAYLGNKLYISGASVTGTATLITPEVPASTTSTNIPHTFLDGVFYNGGVYNIGSGPGSYQAMFNIQQQPNAAAFVSGSTYTHIQSFKLTVMGGPNGLEEYTFTGLSPTGGGGGDNFGFNYTSVTPALPMGLTYNYMDWMMNTNVYRYITKSEFIEVQTTTIPYSAAVYDYTLASNASLVAPTIVANTSLIGGLYTEGTTITPEHVLGSYIDQKGTLTIDGSAKINDDLNVRNSITLKQELTTLGKVVGKSTIPSSIIPADYSTALGNLSLLSYSYGYFYNTYADIYSPGGGFTNAYSALFAVGNVVRIQKTWMSTWDVWWDLQIVSKSISGNYSQITYNVIAVSPTASNNAWYAPNSYDANYNSGGTMRFTANVIDPVKYVLQLDRNSVALDSNASIGLNGKLTSNPVITTIAVSGDKTSLNIYDTGYYNGNISYRYITLYSILGSFANPLSQTATDIKALFSEGNNVTISWNGSTGVFRVSGVYTGYDMAQGADSKLYFMLTYVSGADFISQGTIDYAFGLMGQQISWSGSGTSVINYTSAHLAQFVNSTVLDNKYISYGTWDWTTIGDSIEYIPSTTALKFVKNDGTSVKAITYNNATGAITYDGMPAQTISKDSMNGNIYSSNANGVNNPTDGNSVLNPSNGTNGVYIGLGTSGNGGAVAIGANCSGSQGVAIGSSMNSGYQGVAIGQDTSGGNTGNYGVSIGVGTKAYATKGISLGYGVASGVASTYAYYAFPNLIMTPRTREVILTTQFSNANQYLYMSFMADSISTTSNLNAFSIKDYLNFNASHALITLEYCIGTNDTTDYWATGIKRYRFNDNLSTNKLTELAAPVAAQYGTAQYASNLSVALGNSGSNQTLQVVTNNSDTSKLKQVTIKLSVALFNLN